MTPWFLSYLNFGPGIQQLIHVRSLDCEFVLNALLLLQENSKHLNWGFKFQMLRTLPAL